METLNRQLNRAFNVRSWHGPNLMGALRGVGVEMAGWRPQESRHNIWELAVHAAYWKYRVYRRLTDAEPRAFELKGSDWYRRPVQETKAAWKEDKRLLTTWHGRLCRAVENFDPGRLDDRPGTSEFNYEDLIAGAAAHDIYHAGQIRLLRRMWEEAVKL